MEVYGSVEERLRGLKQLDNDRYGLIEELHGQVTRLRETLEQTEDKLERESVTSREYQKRCQSLKQKLDNRQHDMDRNPFVLLLIDGDCMNFRDDLVLLGGQEGVERLRSAVVDYMRRDFPDVPTFEIIIRIYANLRGLVKVYRDANILDGALDFEGFARRFNMGHSLCEIIDAGTGKECADAKIRGERLEASRRWLIKWLTCAPLSQGVFRLYFDDIHCKHIIFGGSADNGYARLLQPFSGNEVAQKRITMLEGPLFARELAELTAKFRHTSFPEVFRDTKIKARSVSFSSEAPKSPGAKHASFAAATASGNGPTASKALVPQNSGPIQAAVLRNSKGQRVDSALWPSHILVSSIKPRKLCNQFHLLEDCPFQDCKHEHGDRLTGKNLEALRFIARMSPCNRGLDCDDPQCISGHRCPAANCPGANCRFGKMHNVDIKIVQ